MNFGLYNRLLPRRDQLRASENQPRTSVKRSGAGSFWGLPENSFVVVFAMTCFVVRDYVGLLKGARDLVLKSVMTQLRGPSPVVTKWLLIQSTAHGLG